MIRRFLALTVSVVLLFAGTTSVASAARTGPFFTHTTVDTSMHVQALVGSAYAGPVRSSESLLNLCYVVGDPWGPLGNRLWDLVYNRATGVAGFVSEAELADTDQLYECYHTRPPAGTNYFETTTIGSTWQHVQALVGSAYAGPAIGGVLDLCWVAGDWWGVTDSWDLVYNPSTGVAGFISQSELLVGRPYPIQQINCYWNSP